MRRFIIGLCLPFIVVTIIATPNLLIDGVEEAVIEPPCEFEITADFSDPGGTLVFRLYFDSNGNRVPEGIEMILWAAQAMPDTNGAMNNVKEIEGEL